MTAKAVLRQIDEAQNGPASPGPMPMLNLRGQIKAL